MERSASPRGLGTTRKMTVTIAVPSLFFLLPAASLTADTDVYRCTTADDAIEFSQRPCANGEREQKVTVEDRKTGWVPSTIRSAGKTRAAGKPLSRKRRTGGGETATARARRDERCWKKRQLLEEVNWKLRRGYKAGQGTKLRRRRESHEDYIRKFCR